MNQPATHTPSKQPSYRTAAYTLRLLTPAFLGDADQNGRWRTPPIKALLRHWWRVAYAAEKRFAMQVDEMRHEEGLLFGHAWLDSDHDPQGRKVTGRKSAVRIRLEALSHGDSAWAEGHQNGVAPLSTELATSYAWFGLIDSKTKNPLRTGIRPSVGEGVRILKVAWPQDEDERMQRVMRLIRDFGQLGARSRGGWGALHVDDTNPLLSEELLALSQPLDHCLGHDWPASFACDDHGLCIWECRETFIDWVTLMAFVAQRRQEIRTSLKSINGGDPRAVLGTAKGDRLANPLRWRPILNEDAALRLRIYAMPWRASSTSKSLMEGDLKPAWQKVIQELDQRTELQRYTQ